MGAAKRFRSWLQMLLIIPCIFIVSHWARGGAPAAAAAAAAGDNLQSDVAALAALMKALAPWPQRLQRRGGWALSGPQLTIYEQQDILFNNRTASASSSTLGPDVGDKMPYIPCSWHGVTCSRIMSHGYGRSSSSSSSASDGYRVVGLRLPHAGLSGVIPTGSIGRLTALRVLVLHSNRLHGSLPPDLANCAQLRAVYLHNNHFSHRLPSFAAAAPLRTLNLASNNFSSSIPSSYGLLLPRLTALFLQNNSLSGSLADVLIFSSSSSSGGEAAAVSSGGGPPWRLEKLSLANNRLEGMVPPPLQRKFGMSAFQGNNFCGPPLFAECSAPSDDVDVEGGGSSEDAAHVPAAVELPDHSDDADEDRFRTAAAPRAAGAAATAPPARVKARGGWSAGDISAAVVAGVAVALLVAACCVVWCVKRRKKRMRASYLYSKGGRAAGGAGEEYSDERDKGKGGVRKKRKRAIAAAAAAVAAAQAEEEEQAEADEEGAAGGRMMNKEKLVFMEGSRHKFEVEDLLRSSAEVLGKGALGTSYKVTLMQEEEGVVVVKRLRSEVVGGGGVGRRRRKEEEEVFQQQVRKVLGRLRHPNLLPLQAFYVSKDEKLLIHDYMPHGSLSSHLHAMPLPGSRIKPAASVARTAGHPSSSSPPSMDWNTRLKIAIGCARGLAFLHQQQPNVLGAPAGIGKPPPPPLPLVHGNIKSSNVVLSADCEPLLSDFALAPLFKNGADNWVSSRVMAPGYTAPELQTNAAAATLTRPRLTQKADVYSFGVLLLEILTGKAPSMRSDHEGTLEGTDLPRWVQSVVREQWTSEVFDLELLRQENVEEEMVQTLRIAMGCVDPSPEKRPSMIEVVKMLEDVRPNEIHESHDTTSHPMFYTGV